MSNRKKVTKRTHEDVEEEEEEKVIETKRTKTDNKQCFLSAKQNARKSRNSSIVLEDKEESEEVEIDVTENQKKIEEATPQTMLIAVCSERTLRMIRVSLTEKIAYVQQCTPAQILASIRPNLFMSPILIVGNDFLRARIRNAAKNVGLTVFYEMRFPDNDFLLLRYCLSTHTDFAREVIDQFRINFISQFADGCAPLCSTTVARFDLLSKEKRFYCPGSMSLVDVCCTATWTKDLLSNMLRSPPPRSVCTNIRNVCDILIKLRTDIPTFKSTPRYTGFVSEIRQGFIASDRLLIIRAHFTKMLKMLTDKRFFDLVANLRRFVSYVCVLQNIEEVDFSSIEIELEKAIGKINAYKKDYCDGKSSKISSIQLVRDDDDDEPKTDDVEESESNPTESENDNEQESEEDDNDEKAQDTRPCFSSSAVIAKDYFRSMEWSIVDDNSLQMTVLKEKLKLIVQRWTKAAQTIPGCRSLAVVRKTVQKGFVKTAKSPEYDLVFVDSVGRRIDETDAMIGAKFRYEATVEEAKTLKAWRPDASEIVDVKLYTYVWHFLLSFETLRQHVTNANVLRWTIPEMCDAPNGMKLRGFRPYWMSTVFSTANDIDLNRVTALTGRNAGGKSVTLTSIAAIALLANCGLLVPCDRAIVPRFDNIFLCGSAFDLSSENKSTQEVSINDVTMIADCATQNSLILLDCVADSTEAQDASRNTAALLTFFDKIKCPATMIATHALEVATRLKKRQNFGWKTMELIPRQNVPGEYDYRMIDGICTSSMGSAAFYKFSKNKVLLECLAEQYPGISVPRTTTTISNENVKAIREVFVAKVRLAQERYSTTQPVLLELIEVAHGNAAPATEAIRHCCYLRINRKTRKIYIGETNNINKRMKDHRQNSEGEQYDFYIMAVANETVAKHAETFAILALDRLEVKFDSKYDAKRKIKANM